MSDSDFDPDRSEPTADPDGRPTDEPGRQSVGDLAVDPTTRAYAKAIATLYALVGVAAGATPLVVDAVGRDLLEVDLPGGDGPVQVELANYGAGTEALARTAFAGAPLVALTLGVLVGGSLAVGTDERDPRVYVAGGLGALIGTVALWIPAAYLSWSVVETTGFDVGVDAAGLLVNAIVLGLFVAAVTVGTAYVVRNVAPDADASSGY